MALTPEQKHKIELAKKGWENAKKLYDDPEKRKKAQDYFHKQAESVRAEAGYSGGSDGSQEKPINKEPQQQTQNNPSRNDNLDKEKNRVMDNNRKPDVALNTTPNDNPKPENLPNKDGKAEIKDFSDLKSAVGGEDYSAVTNRKGNPPTQTTDLIKGTADMNYKEEEKNIPENESDMLREYATPTEGTAYSKKNTEGMTDEEKVQIKQLGSRWEQADKAQKGGQLSPEEAERIKKEVHDEAEAIRNKYGFSGGTDGTETNKITTGGEGELNGEATVNEETGELVFEGENAELVNRLMTELEGAKDSQAFYEQAMQELLNQDTGVQESDVLSYEEAVAQAEDKINPLYDNAREEYSEKLDADAVRRGVFNQIPQEAMKRYEIDKLDNERASEVANLASDLQSRSKQEAGQMASLRQQEMQNKLNVLMAGLNASGNASQMAVNTINTIASLQMQREQMDFNKDTTNRELDLKEESQDFNQAVTMEELNMKKKQMQQDEVLNNARISQTWANISNDKARLAQASEELGLRRQGMELDENMFKVGLAEKAWERTMKDIYSRDNTVDFNETIYEQLKAEDENINLERGGLLAGEEGASNKAGEYLNEIRNQSSMQISDEEVKDIYRGYLDSYAETIGPFDEYKD